MTDEEFDARYGALKAALLSAWEQHAGGVPADERGLRGQLIGALTSTSMLIVSSEVGLEQCHELFAAIGQLRTIDVVRGRLKDLGAPVPGGWEEAQKAAKKDKS